MDGYTNAGATTGSGDATEANQTTIKNALFDTSGISSFPSAALPTDGVSLAAVIRYIYSEQFGTEFDGTPDLYDVTVTGHDSSATTADEDGSILERLEWLQQNFGRAQADSDQSASTTIIDCLDLAGFGDDYFNTGWRLCVLLNNNSHGGAPEGEWRDITDYVSETGVFTCTAFTQNVEANDYLMVARDEVVEGKQMTFQDVFPLITVVQSVATTDETGLTAPAVVTPTFPTGATLVRSYVVAQVKALNQSAAAHNIGLTLQDNIAAGGWVDILVLTATTPLGLPAVSGASDALCFTINTNTITSGQSVQFRWQVDSDNAGAVIYTSSFVLVMEYDFG